VDYSENAAPSGLTLCLTNTHGLRTWAKPFRPSGWFYDTSGRFGSTTTSVYNSRRTNGGAQSDTFPIPLRVIRGIRAIRVVF